jgi:hypothetical protein
MVDARIFVLRLGIYFGLNVADYTVFRAIGPSSVQV